jgi:hypothetical protein
MFSAIEKSSIFLPYPVLIVAVAQRTSISSSPLIELVVIP